MVIGIDKFQFVGEFYLKEYEHNRDAYTNAKTEFVKKYTEKAKSIYGNL